MKRRVLLLAYALAEYGSIYESIQALAKAGVGSAQVVASDVLQGLEISASQYATVTKQQDLPFGKLLDDARQVVTDNSVQLERILRGRTLVEMTELEWIDPPTVSAFDWPAIGAALRGRPGEWARVGIGVRKAIINSVRNGTTIGVKAEDGFEYRSRDARKNESGATIADLYLRWVPPEDRKVK